MPALGRRDSVGKLRDLYLSDHDIWANDVRNFDKLNRWDSDGTVVMVESEGLDSCLKTWYPDRVAHVISSHLSEGWRCSNPRLFPEDNCDRLQSNSPLFREEDPRTVVGAAISFLGVAL